MRNSTITSLCSREISLRLGMVEGKGASKQEKNPASPRFQIPRRAGTMASCWWDERVVLSAEPTRALGGSSGWTIYVCGAEGRM